MIDLRMTPFISDLFAILQLHPLTTNFFEAPILQDKRKPVRGLASICLFSLRIVGSETSLWSLYFIAKYITWQDRLDRQDRQDRQERQDRQDRLIWYINYHDTRYEIDIMNTKVGLRETFLTLGNVQFARESLKGLKLAASRKYLNIEKGFKSPVITLKHLLNQMKTSHSISKLSNRRYLNNRLICTKYVILKICDRFEISGCYEICEIYEQLGNLGNQVNFWLSAMTRTTIEASGAAKIRRRNKYF